MINTTGATSGAGTAYHSGTPEFTPIFSGVHVTRVTLVLCACCVDRCLSFFFWPLCCLSSDLRLLITPLVSSNFDHFVVCPSIYIFSLPFGIFKFFVINSIAYTIKETSNNSNNHFAFGCFRMGAVL